MKRKLIILSVALFTLCTTLSLSAFIIADDPLAELLKKLEEFSQKNQQEKV